MKDSPVKYLVIRSPDQSCYSDVYEVGGDGNNLYSTIRRRVPTEAQTKWTYFLLGCAILLPWNALIIESSFFLSRMDGSPFYSTFPSYLLSAYTLTNLVFQFHCTFTSKQYSYFRVLQSSPSHRIFGSMIATIVVVTSLWLSTFIRGTPSAFFAFALFSAASLAATNGYLCTAVFARAALLGASFLQTTLSGQGAIGVAVSAVRVATSVIALWNLPSKSHSIEEIANGRDDQAEEIAARIFFGVCTILLCITLVAYTLLLRQPFYQSAIRALERHCIIGDVDERTGLLADNCINLLTENKSPVYQVFRRNLIFLFSIAYVLVVTLAVVPVITTRVRPVNPGIHPLLFNALHFLAFTTGDFLGQYTCSFPRLRVWSGKKILAMSLLRTLLIPLVLLCNIYRPARVQVPPIINSDILFLVIMLTLGCTSGFVTATSFLAISSLEHNPRLMGRREDVDIAASLGSSFLILGLALGTLSSFGVQAML